MLGRVDRVEGTRTTRTNVPLSASNRPIADRPKQTNQKENAMRKRTASLVVLLALGLHSRAAANVVCVSNSPAGGPLVARPACQPGETQLGSLEGLQALLAATSKSRGSDVIFENSNVHIRSGSGSTNGPVNGRGNLIIGYNE